MKVMAAKGIRIFKISISRIGEHISDTSAGKKLS
jgi:hypothetical protein